MLGNKDNRDNVTGLTGDFNSAIIGTTEISSTRGKTSTSDKITSTGYSTGSFFTCYSTCIGCLCKGTVADGWEEYSGEAKDEASVR